MLTAAPARADPAADHAPDHLQMAITKIRELFVDLDERVEEAQMGAGKAARRDRA